ncbi:MAG: hypothetical protein A2X49_06550 [Lentisphaerae bacterium GWF2_52_8]|nr:MAG: hypothetical protein A2X49_06550 [Lentisphaerae bacterium GWF2_52_8]
MTGGNVNGYISGEGEKGVLIRGRLEHEYFSGAFAAEGTMWTGAFPEYGTSQMIPFMAAAGQYPHSPLGVQFASSSLAHPQEPGINDICFRPLWKIWGTFRKQTQIKIFNDYNCSAVFRKTSKDAGHYIMLSKDSKTALLIVTNFSGKSRDISVEIDWKKTGFKAAGASSWKLSPDTSSPGKAERRNEKAVFSCSLEGFGVSAWLLGSEASLKNAIRDFEKPYPRQDAYDRSYLEGIEKQRIFRNEPAASRELYMQVYVDNLAVPYEESMWWDLFDNAFQIGRFDSSGRFVPFGWISKDGFSKTQPEKKDYVWPGVASKWIPLHEILPGAKHEIGIQSLHFGEPFYSFMEIRISPTASMKDKSAYVLEFKNELEPDRSFMRFKINTSK